LTALRGELDSEVMDLLRYSSLYVHLVYLKLT
jgi:hypothetical protein